MRRADRLFQIVEYLKAHRHVVTADTLAEFLEVSTRTIYRDIADLMASSVPITGEAGVGYVLDKDYLVRPIAFTQDELDALMFGAQMVSSWGDNALGHASQSAMNKLMSALPEKARAQMGWQHLFAMPAADTPPIEMDVAVLRQAIRDQHKIRISYQRLNGKKSKRVLWPLGLVCFGHIWLLAGWCETRGDFRNFRLDRISKCNVTGDPFPDERGKRLQDFIAIEEKKLASRQ